MASLFSSLSKFAQGATKNVSKALGGSIKDEIRKYYDAPVAAANSGLIGAAATTVNPNIEETSPAPVYKDTSSSKGYGGSSNSIGGGGASAPAVQDYAIDLSDILNSYTKSAEAQKQTIKDTTAATIKALQDSEASQRATLSKALDRFREDTAEERRLQQSNFNANRADLEAQAYLANRQALQSAAARGLGGSGLQQLSQLQNLINQGAETNTLAQSNTNALNALAQTLARKEEDTTTSLNDIANNLATQINNLNTAEKNQLNEIESNTASLQNQLKYQEAVRAQDARTQAERFAANLAAQNASTASNWALYNKQSDDSYNATVSGLENAYKNLIGDTQDAIKAISNGSYGGQTFKSEKAKNAKINEVINDARTTLRGYTTGLDVATGNEDYYLNQLGNLYKSDTSNTYQQYLNKLLNR